MMSPLEKSSSGSLLLTPNFGPLNSRHKRLTPSRSSPISQLADSAFSKTKERGKLYLNRDIPRRKSEKEKDLHEMKSMNSAPDEFSIALAACLTGLTVKDFNSSLHSSGKADAESSLEVERRIRENWTMPKVAVRHPACIEKFVLDLPNLENDFYLNILDLSKNNEMSIVLGDTVYLKDLATKEIRTIQKDRVSSVRWFDNGKHLAIGTKDGELEIWDTTDLKAEKVYQVCDARIGAIAQLSGELIAAGARDGTISLINLEANDVNASLKHLEICSLSFSQDGKYLASGGNDNTVNIWQAPFFDDSRPLYSFTSHLAAIKALAWNPLNTRSSLLATGGGAADKTIKLWNAKEGKELCSVAAGDAVTNLHWLADGRHLVSTHGSVGSPGSMRLWHLSHSNGIYGLKDGSLISNFHSDRILYSSLSADRKLLLTASAVDEKLIGWDIKHVAEANQEYRKNTPSVLEGIIR